MSKTNEASSVFTSTRSSAPSVDVLAAKSSKESANSLSISSRGLRAEGLHFVLVGREVWPFDQVDAVGDRGHDRFEALADRLRFAGKVDDQSSAADHRGLAREDRG